MNWRVHSLISDAPPKTWSSSVSLKKAIDIPIGFFSTVSRIRFSAGFGSCCSGYII
jgi:hypothetical protein